MGLKTGVVLPCQQDPENKHATLTSAVNSLWFCVWIISACALPEIIAKHLEMTPMSNKLSS